MCKGQNEVLAVLVKVDGALPITAICAKLGMKSADRDARRPVIATIGKLIQKRLAIRANAVKSFGNVVEPEYAATAKGRKLNKEGGRITSGCQGNWNAPPRVMPDTARQRIWSAFRRAKKATFAELVEVVRDDGEDAAAMIENTRKFFKALARAGIALQLRDRADGFAPTSNGFHRYALVKDLGKLAPVTGKKCVFDPNTGERIQYQKKEKK